MVIGSIPHGFAVGDAYSAYVDASAANFTQMGQPTHTEFQAFYLRVGSGTGTFYAPMAYTWSTSNIGTPSGAAGGQIWLLNDTNEAYYSTANVGIGVGDPTAVLHLKAGTTAANTAPLKFNSGSLLTTAEAGAVEFLTDAYYGTITTGAARKTFAFLESPSFTTPNIGAASGSTLTLSDDIIFSANKVIRRNTSDGSDDGSIELNGGGASGNSRGGSLTVYGNENGTAGKIIGRLGNVSGSEYLFRNAAGNDALQILGSDGSATFTSTNDDAWVFNSTNVNGGYLSIKESGAEVGRVGVGNAVDGIGDNELVIKAVGDNLHLEAAGAVGSPTGDVTSFTIRDRTSGNAANVFIDATSGQLKRSTASSARYKTNIETFDDWKSTLLPLRPVTFNYLPSHLAVGYDRQFYGLIAEEVADTVGPDTTLVVFDNESRPENVNYTYFISPLIRGVQELNLNLEGIAGITTPLLGSVSESFVTSFFTNLFSKITTWLADAGNGIVKIFAGDIESNKSSTENLCVKNTTGETCITRDQLDALLAGAGASGSADAPEPVPEPQLEADQPTAEIPEPEPAPEPTPEPAPDSTSSPQAEPTSESTPSAETPEPESLPEEPAP
ncbi:hypothetical protein A3A05_03275 [Candidatus Nomurabacteria bacterium RIFCSPLOWO2_01_FULL_41_12]|uniref:Peptidase S74 domain-containing protein n=1 Tax=Candidatus Nomurabacteria bacterium RIFCSPLOWO2_01_FULL_41_12 TaxID=1801774 RepID=A0A1F6WV19_9BACT|nr:MAG: hypothetical protein A3A05_03275 [Candidatus Nomurabacteria bacterium RIFCSPLOWO2_01_FULL_41_12]